MRTSRRPGLSWALMTNHAHLLLCSGACDCQIHAALTCNLRHRHAKERTVADGTANGSRRDRLPAVRAQIVRGLVENYGTPMANVARQVGISTFGASKILTRGLSR
ncbi:MAG: hypothetical protein DME76_16875 [Verrucomicrobia bacterium]|nr:MAG: hypothetical protein DME76_16875 [Verrucomicrobiota bacterium]